MRQLADYQSHIGEFEAEEIGILAMSVDPVDKAREVAAEVSFPVAYEVTREIADTLGSWWEERRGIIQPSEFIVGADHKVMASSYSDGPLGRMNPDDVLKMIHFYASRS